MLTPKHSLYCVLQTTSLVIQALKQFKGHMGTKAVRFSDKEEQIIKEFLDKNPMLDFSTLARLAISNFVENPELKLKPITSINLEKNKSEKTRIQ